MVQCVYIGIITYETQLGNKQVAQTQRKIKLNTKQWQLCQISVLLPSNCLPAATDSYNINKLQLEN